MSLAALSSTTKVWSIFFRFHGILLHGFPQNYLLTKTKQFTWTSTRLKQKVISFAGIPIKTSLDNATSVLYAGLIGQLTEKARNVVREMVSRYFMKKVHYSCINTQITSKRVLHPTLSKVCICIAKCSDYWIGKFKENPPINLWKYFQVYGSINIVVFSWNYNYLYLKAQQTKITLQMQEGSQIIVVSATGNFSLPVVF